MKKSSIFLAFSGPNALTGAKQVAKKPLDQWKSLSHCVIDSSCTGLLACCSFISFFVTPRPRLWSLCSFLRGVYEIGDLSEVPPISDSLLLWLIFVSVVLLFVLVEFRLRGFQLAFESCLEDIPLIISLAEKGLHGIWARLTRVLLDLRQSDPLLRELAELRLSSLAEEAEELARGRIVFTSTETWRTAYQKLLLTLNVQTYYSVAWVRSSDYWGDPPGRQSMQLNFEIVRQGVYLKRIHILPDGLWPRNEKFPCLEIRSWLDEQDRRGIVVHVVRESDLAGEPDLLRDFAVYGDRATAVQEMDEQARTTRFLLSFDRQNIREAIDRWERLSLYSCPWKNVVDPESPGWLG